MKVCENCGCRVYNLGCVNCDEMDYIEEQAWLDTLPVEYAPPKTIRTFAALVPDIHGNTQNTGKSPR